MLTILDVLHYTYCIWLNYDIKPQAWGTKLSSNFFICVYIQSRFSKTWSHNYVYVAYVLRKFCYYFLRKVLISL